MCVGGLSAARRLKQLAGFVKIEARAAGMKFAGVALAKVAEKIGLDGSAGDKATGLAPATGGGPMSPGAVEIKAVLMQF